MAQIVQRIIGALLAITPFPVQAQIIPDNTLGTENSQISSTTLVDGTTIYQIDQGATRDSNLFHSFSNFDLQANEAAHFTPTAGVERIFARVTGQTPSQLDGTLGVQSSNADLFLLNPQGIVFGPNARLELRGSFIGSSAQAVQFQDGISFSAIHTTPSTPLTVSVPLGLQLGEQAGAIQVQGTGHRLRATDPFLSPYIPESPYTGLQVASQQTLALLAGELALSGGVLQAPSGRIELGSVAQAGLVQLQKEAQGWSFAYPTLTQLGDLALTERASIEVGGGPLAGNLHAQAGTISLREGSIIRNTNLSPEEGGTITINATESLSLSGLEPDINVPTVITQDQFSSGQAGNLTIRSPQLIVQAGAGITNRNYGQVEAGNLQLEVDKLQIEGFADQQPDVFSRIATAALSSGPGGTLQVNAQEIDIRAGGLLGSATLFEGQQGGDVEVNSDRITIQGSSPAGVSSVLGANHIGRSGRSGNLDLNIRILELFDGGLVSTSSITAGDAGNLTVNAQETINLRGSNRTQNLPSSISSSVSLPAPIFQQLFGLSAIPSGAGSNINIQTPNLIVEDGAQITVNNDGIGRAGNLQINAQNIRLKNQGSLDAFTLAGDGGNIQIQSQTLALIDESIISAVALGEGNIGNGGNIRIDSSLILGVDNSDILAKAQQGQGGNINITADTVLGLEFRPQLTQGSDINASSNLGLDGMVQVDLLTANPITNSKLPEIKLVDSSRLIAVGCEQLTQDQFMISGKGGLASTPTSFLSPPIFWRNQLLTTPLLSKKLSQKPPASPPSTIQEAVAWKRLPAGNIQLLTHRPNSPFPTPTQRCLRKKAFKTLTSAS